MNYDAVLEVLKAGRADPKNKQLSQVLDNFEKLVEILKEHEAIMDKNNKKSLSKLDVKKFQEELIARFDIVRKDYNAFCKQMGQTPEGIQNHMNDPQNFSLEEWDQLQSFNRKLGLDVEKPSNKKKSAKCHKKKKSKKWASV